MSTRDKVNNNITLYITLNILISTSLTYFMSSDQTIFKNEGKELFQIVMSGYFGLSIVALVLCSLIINNGPNYPNKGLQVSLFNQGIVWSLFSTSLLIPLLSFPRRICSIISYVVSLAFPISQGDVLILSVVLIVLQALYFSGKFAFIFSRDMLILYMRSHAFLWNPQILVISNEMMKTSK